MKQTNKQDKKGVPFWLMVVLYIFGIAVCANIMYGTILLIAVQGYTNWYFWNVVMSSVGLCLFIGFLFYAVRDKLIARKREKKNE